MLDPAGPASRVRPHRGQQPDPQSGPLGVGGPVESVGFEEWLGCVGWVCVGPLVGSLVGGELVGSDDARGVVEPVVGEDDGARVGGLVVDGGVDGTSVVGDAGSVEAEPGPGVDEPALVGEPTAGDELVGSAVVPSRTAVGMPPTERDDEDNGTSGRPPPSTVDCVGGVARTGARGRPTRSGPPTGDANATKPPTASTAVARTRAPRRTGGAHTPCFWPRCR